MKKLFSLLFALTACTAFGATYYVSNDGNDDNDGTTPASAWQSVKKVNAADILPGDKILFRRGDIWREIVRPHSGDEQNRVTYGAYGEGTQKPRFYGSVDASSPKAWVEVSPNLWSLKEIKPEYFEKIDVNFKGNWSKHNENGAVAQISAFDENGEYKITLKCEKTGKASNHIQIWGTPVTANLPETVAFRFKVRGSIPFTMAPPTIQANSHPWPSVARASGEVNVTTEWQTVELLMTTNADVKLPEKAKSVWHFSLGTMPEGGTLEFVPLEMVRATIDRRLFLPCDVGNIIFDHGNYKKIHTCGMKKWTLDDVKAPGDYYFDIPTSRVFLCFEGNPGKACKSVELALRKTIFDQSNCHDITYENLAIAYGAAHGFGGINTARLTIRKCDLYYIGGGHQFTHPNGRHVRFGNAIEFWNSCRDNLVEENRIWEIYDAALTNQGKSDDVVDHPSNQINITYRNNIIWNSEYSFEFWNRGGITENILFENNLCFDAGNVWSHTQRPDVNGTHMMFYNNASDTKNFVVRNNVFCGSTEVCLRMDNDWREGLTLMNNTYWQDELPVIRFLVKTYYSKADWKKYQEETGLDQGSVLKKIEKP